MALDLPLPKHIYAHSFIMMKDGKMSKSKGNVVYPDMLVNRYGLDATKYFLLKSMPYAQDGEFSPEEFVQRFNSDLCNDLGNLLNRTIGMINKYFDGKIEKYPENISELDKTIENFADETISKIEEKFETVHLSDAISETWSLVARTNKYIDETTPWILAKEERKEELKSVMYHLVENLRKIAILIKPYMEHTANNIFKQLGICEDLQKWDTLRNNKMLENITVTDKPEVLFARLDAEEEVEYLKTQMTG